MTKTSKLTTIISWCLYDWANSAFFTVVSTFIFAAYFANKIAPNIITGTFYWGNATALSGIFVALSSPIFGAIADYSGKRKIWLFCLTYIGIIAAACLYFAYPTPRSITRTLIAVIISTFAFETAMTFYNAILPSITPKNYLGRISGWAWGCGYAGGLTCLISVLFVFVQGNWLHLDTSTYANVRITGPFIALWVLIFSLPLFLFVKDFASRGYPLQKAITAGLIDLKQTLKALPKEKNILLFFLSRIFYIDGLNTLFTFGGIYAAGTFHMSMTEITIFAIVLNITAGLGAVIFAWVDDWIGAKKTIIISLASLIVVGIFVILIHNLWLFWLVAPIMGIFVGPAQAASRSLMVRIAPQQKITEMFGLFAFSGKATAFMGPWLVGTVTELFFSQRIGLAIIYLFFAIGLVILLYVKEGAYK